MSGLGVASSFVGTFRIGGVRLGQNRRKDAYRFIKMGLTQDKPREGTIGVRMVSQIP
jgi:hypothetical protein